jgi:hypothetical protein
MVDPPDPQLDVVSTTLDLPLSGRVDVCAMILPVYWDLAAILIAKEMDSFEPSFVMMNGVAADRQPLWIELGSGNRATGADDGSKQLRPEVASGEEVAKLVDVGEPSRPNLLSWRAVEAAANAGIERHADEVEQRTRFGDVLQGVRLAGFPRLTSTYVCNNVSYVTGYLMDHPGSTHRLLEASPALPHHINEVRVRMRKDFRNTPRVFVHWPSGLATKHHAASADVMGAILDAQLVALARGDEPTRGDNELAAAGLKGGDTY